MSISPMGPIKLYAYEDDDGENWNIRMSQGMAAAVGAAGGSPGNPVWDHRGGKNKVRHCLGDDGAGHKTFIPCPTPGILSAVFTGGTLSVGGTSYTITGRVGERVTAGRFA